MTNFYSFRGTITMISDFYTGQDGEGEGCYKLISIENGSGALVNFVVSPSTYFVDHVMVEIGDRVTGYYDTCSTYLPSTISSTCHGKR
jgi:hypothetical protein